MAKTKIRIRLKGYDGRVVDEALQGVVQTIKASGGTISGPIPLPTKKKIITVLRSPHVDRKSREQYLLSEHKRVLDVVDPSQATVDALMRHSAPSGVSFTIKQ